MFETLANVFSTAAFKYLTVVDVDPKKSNQHEIGGLVDAGIGSELGMSNDGLRLSIPATLVYLGEEGEEPITTEDTVTWYDTRFKDKKRNPEWRLYYKTNNVTKKLLSGDFFLIARAKCDGSLLMIFCPPGGELEFQIRTLFGALNINALEIGLKPLTLESDLAIPIGLIFSRYGIEVGSTRENFLPKLKKRFKGEFPNTREFSKFARKLAKSICPIESPDEALIEWMEVEESAFRQLEKYIVSKRLKEGFGEKGENVDDFIRFSLSVQNRRKSRSGHAFENHLEFILKESKVIFQRGGLTEARQKPDFIFPNSSSYADDSFPIEKLRILGAKTTCKDRWRQVLAEAAKIERKHLITMEPAISANQIEQMRANNLQLIVPAAIQRTYTPDQIPWLMSFKDFINEIKDIQK
jgi:hypothetical protein